LASISGSQIDQADPGKLLIFGVRENPKIRFSVHFTGYFKNEKKEKKED
jgi:hypothetical protein